MRTTMPRTVPFVGVMLASFLACGCGGGQAPRQATGGADAQPLTATTAGTGLAVPAVVQTAVGRYQVRDVQTADRGPAGCSTATIIGRGADCILARPGYESVTVALEFVDGQPPDSSAVLTMIAQAIPDRDTATPPDGLAYLLTPDGSRTPIDLVIAGSKDGIRLVRSRTSISLDKTAGDAGARLIGQVPAGTRELSLVWPGNKPISLRK